jgi:peptide/nickel transport system substrate-binding protein
MAKQAMPEGKTTLSRRALLVAGTAVTASGVVGLVGTVEAGDAQAMGRRPYRGRVQFGVPWPTTSMDPHSLFDPTAAFFGGAVFDTLFALDAKGNPYPTLASALPSVRVIPDSSSSAGSAPTRADNATGVLVHLRPGLRTNAGRNLTAKDVVWSFERSARNGGTGWLAGIRAKVGKDPNVVVFDGADPTRLARKLASPIVAIVPRGFSPRRPNGTGAFEMRGRKGRMFLSRNLHAARGPSFVDGIEVWTTESLQQGLRAFEVGDSDIGWLGSHLHRPRPGAQRFDAGSVGWAVLRTGKESGVGPGVAQALLDGLDPRGLAHFGLGPLPSQRGRQGWYGKPCDLVVRDDAPYLRQLGQAVADLLSGPEHEVRLVPEPVRTISKRRSNGRFAMMLDIARKLGPGDAATIIALLSAVNPRLARRPPDYRNVDARRVLRAHSMGVIGELRVAGSYAPNLHDVRGWRLGSIWK